MEEKNKSIYKREYKFDIKFSNFFPKLKRKNQNIIISTFCLYINKNKNINIGDSKFNVNRKVYDAKFWLYKGLKVWKNVYINHYSLSIPEKDVAGFALNNYTELQYIGNLGNEISHGIKYSIFNLKFRGKKTKIIRLKDVNRVVYLHEAYSTAANLRVREELRTDDNKELIKIKFAYIISLLMGKSKKTLLFEKFGERYEESASVLYEKLIDEGYKDVHFILLKENIEKFNIEPKYRANIIEKFTMKHYIEFFRCNTYMGSDLLGHAVDLRTASKEVQKRIVKDKFNFIFLQHGVKYMVAFDSDVRRFLISRNYKAKFKVVVSSKLEADHFLEFDDLYREEDIFITGLPKFDRNKASDKADKIIIMPTWRAWDYNLAQKDFSQTGYYKFIKNIIDNIPEDYREKVIVLPHPLMLKEIGHVDNEMKRYMLDKYDYNEILKNTRVLITDYSSIAYDAFYRGANVIFVWSEKEECMARYGENAKLMIRDDFVFGDICYNYKEMGKLIESNYNKGQSSKHIETYSKIVEFRDGKNTERLIERLEQEGLLGK